MPVINGVYLKDFPALPASVADANIIPIAESGNEVAYRTTVGGIVTNARVIGKVLTGLSVTGGAVVATDTILEAFGKVQNQINEKQNAITLTTTGTSGAATLVGSTLNIPNYADGGLLSLSAIGSSPNANGGTIAGTVLNLEPASASFGGVVTTGTQTFAGNKTFTGTISGTSANFSASATNPLATTNTGGRELFNLNTTLDGGFFTFRSSGTARGYIGNGAGIISGASESSFGIRSESDLVLLSGGANIRATITSNGNVLVGTTTDEGYKLDVNGTGYFSGNLQINNGSATYLYGQTTSSFVRLDNSIGAQIGYSNYSVIVDSEGVKSVTNGSERMRITSGGDVLVGTTSTDVNTAGGQIRAIGLGIFVRSAGSCLQLNRLTNDGTIASFRTSDIERGSISIVGTTTNYNTSSDYRLKEDLKDFNSLAIIEKIKIYDFKWKDSDKRAIGVMAHELQDILPYAVFGEKDAVNENNNAQMQGVDYSKIVPILVKAIQELNQKLESK